VLEMRDVHRLGAHAGVEIVEHVVEALFQAVELGLRENGLAEDVVALGVEPGDLGGRQAGMGGGRGGRGSNHALCYITAIWVNLAIKA